ncbi:MAG: Qat anti-phage system QueC-like protein QatC [Thiomicrospira sp.]
MVNFVFHHKLEKLPTYDSENHPVLLYDKSKPLPPQSRTSRIAGSVVNSIRSLGVKVSPLSFDFLTISMAVTAADTFCNRSQSANSWARELNLNIPLYNPSAWYPVARKLEKSLNFLTGDQWSLKFSEGGLPPPKPKTSQKAKRQKGLLRKLNCVSLFSGGLDSAVGAIDLVNGKSPKSPLLVSHAYKGDASKQSAVERVLKKGGYSRFFVNADPHLIQDKGIETDITMRGRSFNFIAMGLVGLSALQKLNPSVNQFFIPENGYISLNPPLTRRRIGSLSTRTTHPYYLSILQEVFNEVGFDVVLTNPYQLKTKGEMIKECVDQNAIAKAIPETVSCSNWHRKGIQCGRCVPCLIRRASIYEAGINLDSNYLNKNLKLVLNDNKLRDDLFGVMFAINQLPKQRNIINWVRKSGPLPNDTHQRQELANVFERGLFEVDRFLKSESIK